MFKTQNFYDIVIGVTDLQKHFLHAFGMGCSSSSRDQMIHISWSEITCMVQFMNGIKGKLKKCQNATLW